MLTLMASSCHVVRNYKTIKKALLEILVQQLAEIRVCNADQAIYEGCHV